jgi:hypothetical protein
MSSYKHATLGGLPPCRTGDEINDDQPAGDVPYRKPSVVPDRKAVAISNPEVRPENATAALDLMLKELMRPVDMVIAATGQVETVPAIQAITCQLVLDAIHNRNPAAIRTFNSIVNTLGDAFSSRVPNQRKRK